MYAGARKKTSRFSPAFTLVELVIVIFIISLTAALIMPNVWNRTEDSVISEAKRVGNTMRYIFDEAAGKKRDYVITFNLDEGGWAYESETDSRVFTMKDDVVFKDVIVPSLGEISFGEVVLKFGATGAEEPVILHLTKNDIEYTVLFNHMNGRAKVQPGHIVWEREMDTGTIISTQ